MSWAQGVAFGFDTETTGTDVFTDRIVTASIVKFIDGEQAAARTWMINPGVPIHPEATKVHGITDAVAQELGVDPAEAVPDIGSTVAQVLRAGTPLFVFNAPFDLTLLSVELERHNHTALEDLTAEHWNHLIDPMVLARGIDKNLTRTFKDPATGKGWVYKLPNLCDRYKVKFTESHEASADAAGCLSLGLAIAKKHTDVGEKPPSALFNVQQTWHKNNQASLKAFWEKQGDDRAPSVDTAWPLHSRVTSKAVAGR